MVMALEFGEELVGCAAGDGDGDRSLHAPIFLLSVREGTLGARNPRCTGAAVWSFRPCRSPPPADAMVVAVDVDDRKLAKAGDEGAAATIKPGTSRRARGQAITRLA